MSILQCATHLDGEEGQKDISKIKMNSNSLNSCLIYIKWGMYIQQAYDKYTYHLIDNELI